MIDTNEVRAILERLHDAQERESYSTNPEDCRTALDATTLKGRFIVAHAAGAEWESHEQAFETLLQAGRELADAIDRCWCELGWLQQFEECAAIVGYEPAYQAAVLGNFERLEALAIMRTGAS